MSTDRIGPKAPRAAYVTLDDGLTYPCCRGCSAPIRRKDGAPARGRTWCSTKDEDGLSCADKYLAGRSSRGLRRVTFQGDHGRCAECGRECCEAVTRDQAMVRVLRGVARWYVRRGYWRHGTLFFREVFAWQADHIVSLEEGGSREMSNVQTLCEPCHIRKTIEHARRRAMRRRQERIAATGQLALDL
jgi:5-methylcytosine-specific restriction endonuclease McrA